MAFVGTTTLAGGFLSIQNIFIPMVTSPKVSGDDFKGALNSTVMTVMMICVNLILADAVPRWFRYWARGRTETLRALELPAA